MPNDKIFIEKSQTIRLIIDQAVGLEKVLDLIRAGAKVERFEAGEEIVLLIEKKDERSDN